MVKEKDGRIYRKRAKRGGFTLLESVIVAGFVMMLMYGVHLIIDNVQGHYFTGSALAALQAQSRVAIDRIADEVRETGGEVLLDAKGFPLVEGATYNTVILRRNAGYSGGIVWGEMIAYTFRYAQNEYPDGLDNDNDGLVDEGEIVRIEVPQAKAEEILAIWESYSGGLTDDSADADDVDDLTEGDLLLRLMADEAPQVVICQNLKKQALHFVRFDDQDQMKVAISAHFRRIDENKRLLGVSGDTVVALRNQG
ncbi:MAG: hypothetical protein AMS15_04280 [Planctomycetes bacterium DG_23]|nr:MAG: hypothetical protein AMS15_04280 [Planctomycetes bacterium DG_23]